MRRLAIAIAVNRKAAKMSQRGLGRISKVGQYTIHKMEYDQVDNPGVYTIAKLERALGLAPGELYVEACYTADHESSAQGDE